MLRVASAVVMLAVVVGAQEQPPANTSSVMSVKTPMQGTADETAAPMFYKAFYLWHGEQKEDAALELYRKFLDAAPKSPYAGKAARDAVAILRQQDKAGEAEELHKKFADAIAALPPEEQRRDGSQQGRPWGGPGRGEPGGRGARGMMVDFTTMSDDEIEQRVQRLDEFVPRMLDRVRERAGDEAADEAEKRWKHVKELLDKGDKEAAQKEWEAMSEHLFPRRGGR